LGQVQIADAHVMAASPIIVALTITCGSPGANGMGRTYAPMKNRAPSGTAIFRQERPESRKPLRRGGIAGDGIGFLVTNVLVGVAESTTFAAFRATRNRRTPLHG